MSFPWEKSIITLTHQSINGIPSAAYFKKKVGLSTRKVKTGEYELMQIYNALKSAESYRMVRAEDAIPKIRAVRRACNIYHSFYGKTPSPKLDFINQMRTSLNKRVNDLADHVFGMNKATDKARYEERLAYNKNSDALNRVEWGTKIPGKTLGDGYQLERATSQHFKDSVTSKWLKSNSRLGLNDWVNTVDVWDREDRANRPVVVTAAAGVRYLSAQERENYRVDIRGGKATDPSGAAFSTAGMFSHESGNGWGIFAMGFQNLLYVAEHAVGAFHHSSFFSGAPIKSAGEICVNNGKVVGLTNKTGHYKAGPAELKAMLVVLRALGVNLATLAVSDPTHAKGKWFSGEEALVLGGALRPGDTNTMTAPARPMD